MSDRIAVFDNGVIQQVDTAGKLYEEPANAFVAGFIGESNTLHGTVERLDGGRCGVRLDAGGSVTARVGNVASAGRKTLLSIRPERVFLNGASERCENRFSATVQELIYLGDHVRVRMDVAGNPSFTAKVAIADLDHALKPGERVTAGVATDHVRAFEPTDA
jgi:putative spermidine/putrescine transport system ATP-binding protein